MKTKTPTIRNFVAKHAQRSGAGCHQPKKGKLAPHRRQRRNWKLEISKYF